MSDAAKPRVFSGIQPTSDSFHIGNFLGALSNWVSLQDTHDCVYCVVDLHAITVEYDPAVLRHRTRVSYAQLMALGVDVGRSTLFVQSQVPAHAELAWALACITGTGEAGRMTQFKDKSQKEGSDRATVGLFTYPILQAADILLYQAAAVPVGEDQRQHLELSRDLAGRFNARFGQTFTVPSALIVKDTAKIVDLQDPTSKMSKSLPAGCLSLLDTPAEITKKVKRAVTDSDGEVRFDAAAKPGLANLLAIEAALSGRTPQAVAESFSGGGYGPIKAAVAESVVAFVEPVQARVSELLSDVAELDRIIAAGGMRAAAMAAPTLASVYERVGFVRASG